jgi:four helix bundle protein
MSNEYIPITYYSFFRSGTSIGANCSEAKYAQSNKDFINQYSIALKEANETLYWIKIMIKSELVSKLKFQNLIEENEKIIKILTTSINKLKEKSKIIHSLLITHYSLLITHYSLLITHYSLLITHYSLLITHYSLLITHYSLLITHYSFNLVHR